MASRTLIRAKYFDRKELRCLKANSITVFSEHYTNFCIISDVIVVVVILKLLCITLWSLRTILASRLNEPQFYYLISLK